MNRTLVSLGVAVALSVLSASRARATALATYDFETYATSADTGAPASSATPPAAGVTASNLAPNGGTATPATGFLGRGANGNVSNYFFASTSAPGTPSNGAGRSVGTQSQYTYDTIAGAVAGNTYYSLKLTPASGSSLSFGLADMITFALQVRSLNASGTVPYNVSFVARSSADGFAYDLGTSASLGVTLANTNISGNRSISLAGIGSLIADQALTIRLYPIDNQQAAGNDDFKFDNVIVNGSISEAPEPSAAMLGVIGVATAFLVGRSRRRAEMTV